MQIKDRVFLITGASSGLGAAVAKMAVDAGSKVMLLDVNAEAGDRRRRRLARQQSSTARMSPATRMAKQL